LIKALEKTPVNIQSYKKSSGKTPYTLVLSDPDYNNGEGERVFVNSIGAAWNFKVESLSVDFFDADIILYGGTALVPNIHDNLHILLKNGKEKGAVNIVSTVYDFRNEKHHPGKPWPLGNSKLSFPWIDLLITDNEEALKISGQKTIKQAATFFIDNGISAFIITNGAQNISIYSNGEKFQKLALTELPISEAVSFDLQNYTGGDTTGCGDNFVGGVLASVSQQMDLERMDLSEAACWGTASGGFACFYPGGTYFENKRGEKFEKVNHYYINLRKQIEKEKDISEY
jgi:sugar/nucleoside kinase (ribokinase family)